MREKILGESGAYDRLAELEIKSFHADEARAIRMEERGKEIRGTTSRSPVKLALLKARQFVDEFS